MPLTLVALLPPCFIFLCCPPFICLSLLYSVSVSQRSQLISMSANVKSLKVLQIDFFSSRDTRVPCGSSGSKGDPWYYYPSQGFSNIFISRTAHWDPHFRAEHSCLIKMWPCAFTSCLWVKLVSWEGYLNGIISCLVSLFFILLSFLSVLRLM